MKEAVSTCRRHKLSALASSIFFHISCPLLYNLVVLDWQVVEFVKLLFWVQRSGKIIQGIPRAAIHLMPQTRVVLLLAPFFTKASLHLLRVFSPYRYGASSSFSPFHLYQFLREKACHLWFHQFIFYFHHFICRQSWGLSSESYLTSKFSISFFFALFTYSWIIP